jgi:hypothetical protein
MSQQALYLADFSPLVARPKKYVTFSAPDIRGDKEQ